VRYAPIYAKLIYANLSTMKGPKRTPSVSIACILDLVAKSSSVRLNGQFIVLELLGITDVLVGFNGVHCFHFHFVSSQLISFRSFQFSSVPPWHSGCSFFCSFLFMSLRVFRRMPWYVWATSNSALRVGGIASRCGHCRFPKLQAPGHRPSMPHCS